jgi:DNA-binding GntR family transcriptional regulator
MGARSLQYRLLTEQAHIAGVLPGIDEHAVILDALRTRQPDLARSAMRDHRARVLEALLEATEVHGVEQTRARVEAQRRLCVAKA